MLFNSLIFLLFAGTFFAIWPRVRANPRARWAWLFGASMLFYGFWDWRFLGLILFSGLIDYFAALGMASRPRWKKALLWLSITANIGTLALFKYAGFFLSAINDVAGAFGGDAVVPVIRLALPVGISFYTFQSMSYTIDVYRGQLKPVRSVLHFFAYLSMFPQLVAGPIIRASDLLHQLEGYKKTSAEDRIEGLRLITFGFFKKMVIADNMAPAIQDAFARAHVIDSTPYWWIIITMFAVQVYCDFAGYSDIARGLARWMGYHFKVNFDHPFAAKSLREFWARWHISLTTWFRDYVYMPLGGPMKGLRGHVNTWVTMALSGFWHGANWTFLLWGFSQGVLLSVEKLLGTPKRLIKLPSGRWICTALVIAQIWSAFALFGSRDLTQAFAIMNSMYIPTEWNWLPVQRLLEYQKQGLLVLALFIARELWYYLGLDEKRVGDLLRTPATQTVGLACAMVLCVYFRGPGMAFIYFQF
ncbi:MAG: membrane-bound O-acyltransferase family protein [Planctomycetes bacterium]|jgi:D-alanyl-lipoteichoic acid acyltransferase DltB (MBOAT superfamily)|nr:membrane-bound O-acyltransferase family protein [Planctomycetota bacterium]